MAKWRGRSTCTLALCNDACEKRGHTFEAIKDEARRDLAQRYLSQPDLPLTQITALLGYSEQSAFGRSCRRWFDMTPREARARFSSSVPTTNTRS